MSQSKARLDEIHAQAQHQKALLARHQLKAPFSGVISKKFRELGEWVTPGEAVFELVNTDHPRLDFAVAEDYLAELTPKTRVNFTLNALPCRAFTGQEHHSAPNPERAPFYCVFPPTPPTSSDRHGIGFWSGRQK